jgi:hypothetical protein
MAARVMVQICARNVHMDMNYATECVLVSRQLPIYFI